jgi:hypothetical protein
MASNTSILMSSKIKLNITLWLCQHQSTFDKFMLLLTSTFIVSPEILQISNKCPPSMILPLIRTRNSNQFLLGYHYARLLVLDAYGRGVQTLTPLLKEVFSVHVSHLQQLKTLIHNIQKGKYFFFFFRNSL